MLSKLLVLLILLAFTSVECQLQFNATSPGTKLTVRCDCTPSALQAANMAHVISMGISKNINGKDETLMSMLSLDGSTVTHNIEDGITSGNVQFDGSQCFVQITWPYARDSMNGDYKCTLSGLDANNIPVSLNQNLQVNLKDPDPNLSASPITIEAGLSRDLTLNCTIKDFNALNLKTVTSIELSFIHESIDQLLASISVFDPATAKPGSDIDTVTGYVGNNGQNYLSATWLYPDDNSAGSYICEILGINTNSMPVHFVQNVDVETSDPARELLLQKIRELDTALSGLASQGASSDDLRNLTQMYNYYYNLYNNVSVDWARVQNDLQNATATNQQLIQQISALQAQLGTMGDYYVLECNFDTDMCGMKQENTDDQDWTRFYGATSSVSTGPDFDNTLGNDQGYYMYLEASSPVVAGNTARLDSPDIPPHRRKMCMTFWYHLYGQTMGTLNVYIAHSGNLGSPIFSLSGDKGSRWLRTTVTIPADNQTSNIVFEAVRGSDYYSDMAIDDVLITDVNC